MSKRQEPFPDLSPATIVIFDIDGVLRDVSGSYRRAIADTVEHFTNGAYRPSQSDIDALKAEGIWNNDWDASQELIYRYFEAQGRERSQLNIEYDALVAFFQRRYRGPDDAQWTGYICDEPLLLHVSYLENLSQAGIAWGFFSGATAASARFVLETRLKLHDPVLVAMEDAPSKPDPMGLLKTVKQLEARYHIDSPAPVFYAGDTVADLQTVRHANHIDASRSWIGVGILPPHAHHPPEYRESYAARLQAAGAAIVLNTIEELTPQQIESLLIESFA
ncbi:MAG: TIGR01548 family HAD-type hydrolase [Elainellaceae cyanobacterium]